MNRLTVKSNNTELPIPKMLQESCEEFSCKYICEIHDYECIDCPIQACMTKLSEYEDLEEENLIIKLPCKVGDILYGRIDLPESEIIVYKVKNITLTKILTVTAQVIEGYGLGSTYDFKTSDFGKYVFLTREKA